MDFTYDAASGRFRDAASGRFVPEAAVRQAVDTVLDASTVRVRALSQRLLDGQTSLAEWQQAMANELRVVHVAVGIVAHGGQAEMSQSAYGFLGSEIKPQLSYLRNFAAQLASGAQPLDGRVLARAELYAQAGRGTFIAVQARDARLRGADEERWRLSSSEHCGGCVDRAGQGWAPLGTLPGYGSQPCRSRCRCVQMTRRAEVAA
jgi:hypothetical protein